MQVYKTTNLINGKWYIGKDETDRSYYLGSGKALANAIKKYGKESFEKVIIEECNSREELNSREAYWIKATNAQKNCMSYNIGAGGIGGDWTTGFTKEEVKEIYKKRGNQTDNFKGAKLWLESLSNEEKSEYYKNQAEKRTYDWYVSRLDDDTEHLMHNLHQWCKDNDVDSGDASCISNPTNKRYGKSHKGWRIRRADQPKLPPYVNHQHSSHTKSKWAKGKSWKLINGKRVWIDKEIIQ